MCDSKIVKTWNNGVEFWVMFSDMSQAFGYTAYLPESSTPKGPALDMHSHACSWYWMHLHVQRNTSIHKLARARAHTHTCDCELFDQLSPHQISYFGCLLAKENSLRRLRELREHDQTFTFPPEVLEAMNHLQDTREWKYPRKPSPKLWWNHSALTSYSPRTI